ncbi:nuclease-related domain-containing protein [Neobacillus cucumis]|uniref:nuclease-related domain-containing protein n=1 Tax=Neobacillus cucumis TaxID=1740721 RepID=UPI002853411A|nr:nuclease-related domain-containing protein [Neobacillus cucumis]MDR4949182.1 nuclease-related domain-containing protein [Neobacillus cucumis]
MKIVEERMWNMIFKKRTESLELKLLRSLDMRAELIETDKQRFHNLAKGYEGELMFDSFTEKLECENFLLNDLLLEHSGNKFQIDTLMVTQDPLYLFDVKNYEGDFFYESGMFRSLASKKEIQNPLLQLERCQSLLRQLLQSIGIRLTIEAYVIFINPRFHLFQSPLNKPIIYPNQLPDFMKKLNRKKSVLNGRHRSLAEQLAAMHQIISPYEQYVKYTIDKVKKGFFCDVCGSFHVSFCGRHLQSEMCGHREGIDAAVLRMVEEIKLLYPNEKITTNLVFEWCQVIGSKQAIARILKQNFCVRGNKRHTYYE